MIIEWDKVSDESLTEIYTTMKRRLADTAEHPEHEEEYRTNSPDWQEEYSAVKAEMQRRGLPL